MDKGKLNPENYTTSKLVCDHYVCEISDGVFEFSFFTMGVPDTIEPAYLTRAISIADFYNAVIVEGIVPVSAAYNHGEGDSISFNDWFANCLENDKDSLCEVAQKIINRKEGRTHYFNENGAGFAKPTSNLPDVFEQILKSIHPTKTA